MFCTGKVLTQNIALASLALFVSACNFSATVTKAKSPTTSTSDSGSAAQSNSAAPPQAPAPAVPGANNAPGGALNTSPTPQPPTHFQGQAPNASSITLSWHDNSSGTYTFAVSRKSTFGADAYVAVTMPNLKATQVTDTNGSSGLNASWFYTYQLITFDPQGNKVGSPLLMQIQVVSGNTVLVTDPSGSTTTTPVSSTGGACPASPTCSLHVNPAISGLQTVLNNAASGSTICFDAGTYKLGTDLVLLSNKNYIGHNAVFDGNGFWLSDISNTTISGFTLQNISGNAIHYHQISGANIVHNNFHNILGAGIYTENDKPQYTSNTDQTHIDDNSFDGVASPIHILFYGHGAGNTVSRNLLKNTQGNGIVLQSSTFGVTVDSNWIDNWVKNTDVATTNGQDNHIAISCATAFDQGADSKNVVVSNNYIGGNGFSLPAQHSLFTGLEIMGSSSVVSGNYFFHWGVSVANGETDNTPSQNWSLLNNTFVGDSDYWINEIGGSTPLPNSGNLAFVSTSAKGAPAIPTPPANAGACP